MNKDYYRAYVALTEEQQGYSLAGRRAFGKAVVEARGAEGKLLVSVQGLKPQVFYKVYLIAKHIGAPESRYSGVFMGDLPVNERGAGDLKAMFDAHSVGGSGFMVGLFTAVAVVVHNAPVLTAPLTGYVGEPVFWKNGFEFWKKDDERREKTKKNESESVIVEIKELRREKAVEEPVEEPVPVEVFEEPAVEGQAVAEEAPEIAGGGLNPHERFRGFVRDYRAKIDEYPVAPTNQNTPDTLFRRSAKMSPFIRRDPDIEWVRIAPEHASLIGLAEIGMSAFASDAFMRYRHLVLGRTAHGKYILGIPDMYNVQTAPTPQSMGLTFARCDGGDVAEGSYGYWLAT